jgi:hypothetical protein
MLAVITTGLMTRIVRTNFLNQVGTELRSRHQMTGAALSWLDVAFRFGHLIRSGALLWTMKDEQRLCTQ